MTLPLRCPRCGFTLATDGRRFWCEHYRCSYGVTTEVTAGRLGRDTAAKANKETQRGIQR